MLLEQSAAPGLTLNNTEIKLLLYVEVLVHMSLTEQGSQQLLHLLDQFCQNWSLTVNLAKTKMIIFQKNGQISGKQTHVHSRKHRPLGVPACRVL